jgi:hypothetical protein
MLVEFGNTRLRIRKTPIKERIPVTLVGLSHGARLEMRWGLADIVRVLHIHPSADICFEQLRF